LSGEAINWLTRVAIHPRIVGESDDTALMKAFGQAGLGVFPVPTVIADEVMNAFAMQGVGRADDATVKSFAISRERELKQTRVVAVNRKARKTFTPLEALHSPSIPCKPGTI
jgi:LysR family transcriptional activator of nhaA